MGYFLFRPRSGALDLHPGDFADPVRAVVIRAVSAVVIRADLAARASLTRADVAIVIDAISCGRIPFVRPTRALRGLLGLA
ncbi:MAG TPA: hypothetical protein VG317_21085 [Pseudonocardiaceae bacterium]|nr:hypothetical protein [Pseudonocardiaceae bacterium]